MGKEAQVAGGGWAAVGLFSVSFCYWWWNKEPPSPDHRHMFPHSRDTSLVITRGATPVTSSDKSGAGCQTSLFSIYLVNTGAQSRFGEVRRSPRPRSAPRHRLRASVAGVGSGFPRYIRQQRRHSGDSLYNLHSTGGHMSGEHSGQLDIGYLISIQT